MEISKMIQKIRYSYDSAKRVEKQFSLNLDRTHKMFFVLNNETSSSDDSSREIEVN